MAGAALLVAVGLFAGCDSDAVSSLQGEESAIAQSALHHDLEGRVLLKGRNTHAGILVFLGATPYNCYTDSLGNYRIAGVPPGRYEVLAQKTGYQESRVDEIELLESGPAGARLRTVVLEPEESAATPFEQALADPALAGRVALENAETHGGVVVRVKETGEAAETDAGGEYRFADLAPGEYELEFVKPGYLTGTARAAVREGARNRADPVILQEMVPPDSGRSVVGLALMFRRNGEPSADFDRVRVSVDGLNAETTLAPDGSFVLEGLPNRTLQIVASADGYRLENPALADLSNLEMAEVILRLLEEPPAASDEIGGLEGVVQYADVAAPHNGILIFLSGTQFTAVSDAEGRFRINGIPEGDYSLQAVADGYEPQSIDGLAVPAGDIVQLPPLALQRKTDRPRVIETSPARGERGVTVQERMPVRIRFSHAMRPETLREAFSIRPDLDYLIYAGRDHPESGDRTLYVELIGISADRAAQFNTRYEATISPSAMNEDGETLAEPYSFAFETGGPRVVGSFPQDGDRSASVNMTRPLEFYLNDRAQERALGSRSVTVRPRLMVNPNFHRWVDTRTGWSKIQVYATWQPGVEYAVTLENGLENEHGKRFENTPYTIRFRTAEWRVLQAPSIDAGR